MGHLGSTHQSLAVRLDLWLTRTSYCWIGLEVETASGSIHGRGCESGDLVLLCASPNSFVSGMADQGDRAGWLDGIYTAVSARHEHCPCNHRHGGNVSRCVAVFGTVCLADCRHYRDRW